MLLAPMARTFLLALAFLPAAVAGCGGDSAPVGEERPPPSTEEDPVPYPPAADAPATITEADAGKTFELAVGGETSLRLSSEYSWSDLSVRGASVELVPVDYLRDPGYVEWLVQAVAPGTTTIGAEGTCAAAHGCPDETLRFQVTITVAP